MRTLLVDNHDSYSHNLFQLIARTIGTEPMVVRNDDAALRRLDPDDFDALVISPGPGHPGRARDFGLAADLLSGSGLPTLGVCLGHQGIALATGARVERAPAPRHGHLSVIRHRGEDLFAHIPQHFTGVRYHSLAVPEPLPPALEATAWAEDGVLMGLRHRSLPQWSVQFHPESVATEYGAELIANFARLARAHRPPRGPAARRGRRAPAARRGRRTPPATAAVGATSDGYRLHVRTLSLEPDTDALFRALFARSRHAFWLDSSRVEPGLSRFSFLGDAGGPLAETVRYRAGSGEVEVTAADGGVTTVPGTVFDHLRAQLARRRIAAPTLPFDFTCGYVGWFGYELRADCGSPLARAGTGDDAAWIFADRLVAVDHERGETHLLCLARDDGEDGERAAAWLRETGTRLTTLPSRAVRREAHADARAVDGGPAESWLARSREQYLADIRQCHEELHAGESYEICLTNTVHVPVEADALAAHSLLRRLNPAPYAAFLRFGDTEAVCSSPERFLRITPDGTVESKPIKGTAPRGADPAEDARLKAALAHDPKTRAENLMIVDLLRNDLGRVCEIGSVHVPHLMRVESYATVHQLVSTVRGTLRPGTDAVDCVRACFPGGSMTGAPKLRTMEIIDRLEGAPRGLYSGSIGYLGLAGGADLNIVIRTAVRSGGRWTVGAGGAIVLGSDPAEEYREMLLKAAAPVRALLRSGRGPTVPAEPLPQVVPATFRA
ncbi:aminodeoxychorismate synthase component I [Streptomyces albofaciens JCM 4342]|uniref:aminodeoxychorismate synthase component I n=1 Tax=Streptomyces albofaciens TaxID=66866 RepID=UPI00123C2E87|nr:aminodeoxychorismate synthase component I [Streptomyces albofaciens]KAA6213160.1 aminodeoxychorismate synthase component I [Streptomyces albofaciens JCM 4342]